MNSADIAAKYQKTYYMPPEVTYDWVKKEIGRASCRERV